MNINFKKPTSENLKKIYSSFFLNEKLIKHEVYGKSHCGRDIDLFYIGDMKKIVLLAGAFHGSEWLTSLCLINFLIEFSKSNILNMFLKKYTIAVFPVINPDGVEISINGAKAACKYKDLILDLKENTKKWQANARGVDINHNFDASWDELKKLENAQNINKPGRTRFGGYEPESENETKTIVKFCNKNFVEIALAFHSQGEEIYWEFGPNTPTKSKKIADLLANSSGYKLSTPEPIATGGGFKDWFILKFKRPAFTIEIGNGENPLPLSDFDIVYPKIKNMLYELISNFDNN